MFDMVLNTSLFLFRWFKGGYKKRPMTWTGIARVFREINWLSVFGRVGQIYYNSCTVKKCT